MIKIIDTANVSDFTVFAREDEQKNAAIEKTVEDIIADVRQNGDSALYRYSQKFDGCALDSLKVSDDEIDAALAKTDEYFLDTLRMAKENIARFHSAQVRPGRLKRTVNHKNINYIRTYKTQ